MRFFKSTPKSKKNSKRKGFTLVELLVVIGILAVLAAVAIPSVAGLIEKGNVSTDTQNATEMTNAVTRWVSEYELYIRTKGKLTLLSIGEYVYQNKSYYKFITVEVLVEPVYESGMITSLKLKTVDYSESVT